MERKYNIHVISHTHWDREWYKPFQHYRMQLVKFFNSAIKIMEADPEYKCFHMDGQTSMLEDYLEIVPENEARLRKLIKDGRMLIGPWYTQPDEFIVSGEALIRNLMLGHKMGDDWQNCMKVGYTPDTFSHTSQMPQIWQGFGIDNAVVFRGITCDQVKSEFKWQSPDGSEVLAIKLPDDNAYSNWWYKLKGVVYSEGEIDFEKFREGVLKIVEDCEEASPTTSNLLFMDGVDHVFPNPKTPMFIRDINENLDIGFAKHSTLLDFAEAIKAENPELDTVTGELRWSNRRWLLQRITAEVLSSRIHLKQMNHECQNLLEKWAEPFSAIAWKLGSEHPAAYIWHAWKYLLQNHAHDSICGCSIDQVHRDMFYRFEQARLIAQPIVDESLQFIADKIDTSNADTNSFGVAIFNPLSWERSETFEAEIGIPLDWELDKLAIIDADGKEIPFKLLGSRRRDILIMNEFGGPWSPQLNYCSIVLSIENVPALGYKTIFIKKLDKIRRNVGSMLTSPNTAENEHLSLTVESDGTLTIKDKSTERVFSKMMIFEDCGDFGDGYLYAKPMYDTVVTSLGCKTQVSVAEDNAIRTVFKVDTVMPVPASRDTDWQKRSAEYTDLTITSYVSLAKGAKRVDITTEVDNTAGFHRIRALFPSGIGTDYSYAENAFDVVKRPVKTPDCIDWLEPLPTAHPQKTFVDLNDGKAGLSIINESLYEYQTINDEARTIALTLMRCVGNGVCGAPEQVEGQMIGKQTFKYAIAPHAGTWLDAQIWQQGWSHNSPMKAMRTEIHEGTLPLSKSFVEIDNPAVLLSAMKKAEKSDDIVLRAFNIGESKVSCVIAIDGSQTASQTNMNEETIGQVEVKESKIALDIKSKQVVTLAVDLKYNKK